uniref:Small ribosomal subunit protein uS5 n=1 Tax=uncultured Chloroflexi bacterium Rifle_16ft_4_minimus_450 TaxID=1665075 RepID=A0A0H4TTN8_9CHLR|nr:30S ribosomal protein S5, small subunit ribosomal protein S5 [uncultured Chloroflexi bacterium Rifle_16ft_4_minimus_450]
MRRDFRDRSEERNELDERLIDIARVAKVVKGGRRFSFRVTVVVGDNKGQVGLGIGKARGVPEAIRKGTERAKKDMHRITLAGKTIPHEVTAKFGGALVLLRPASPGTGVIAGGPVRAVLEAAGVRDILTKSLGSANVLNVARATLRGLESLKRGEVEAIHRGKEAAALMPFWERKRHAQ